MDVAFVKNTKNHIHHENRADQKQRKRGKQLSEHKRLALESRLHAVIFRADLAEGAFDEVRRIAYRHTGYEIKVDRNAVELIEVVDRLRAHDGAGGSDGAERIHMRCRIVRCGVTA